MKAPHWGVGASVAGLGVGLWAIDKFTTPSNTTCPSGTYCGSVYGPSAPLAGVVSASPVDPTILLVGLGIGLWLWHKYGK